MPFTAPGMASHHPKIHVLILKFLLRVFKSVMQCWMPTCLANSREEFLISMYTICNLKWCVGENYTKYCDWRLKYKARSLKLLKIWILASFFPSKLRIWNPLSQNRFMRISLILNAGSPWTSWCYSATSWMQLQQACQHISHTMSHHTWLVTNYQFTKLYLILTLPGFRID